MGGRLKFGKLILIFSLLATLLPAQTRAQQKKIVIAGAQSVMPLAREFSVAFRKAHPEVEIEIRRGGSNYAFDAAARAEIDIGLAARSPTPDEKRALEIRRFGRDAILVVTYPRNPVGAVTLEQLRSIYVGKVTHWDEIGGEKKRIVPLRREKSSNIHAIFTRHVFGKGFTGEQKAFTVRATKGKILKTVKRIDGSLGYGVLRQEQAEAEGVRVLAIDGKLPTRENVRQALYPITRPHLVISRKNPTGIARQWMLAFIDFVARKGPSDPLP